MKLLIWYMDEFGFKTSRKSLDDALEQNEEKLIKSAVVAFIQMEEEDEENSQAIETKLVKQLKWAAKKNETKRIVLHSFAHLSDSKASAEVTQTLFNNSQQRLEGSGYGVTQTPFGYFLDLHIKAPGHSMARIFKDINVIK